MISLFKEIFYTLCIFLLVVACTPSTSAQRYSNKKQSQSTSQQTKSKKIISKKSINDSQLKDSIPDSLQEFDEAPPQESTIDRKQFIANYKNYINPDVPLGFREEILLQVIKFLDSPYKYGGNTEDGIDCSGFTRQIFLNALNIELPRSAREQFNVGEQIEKEDLSFGDLVFFNTQRRSNPGHVGIYIGDNQFIHASRTLGVTISSLDETYYKKRYVGARRIDTDTEIN
ncbi:MAG: C40 family peptidase [Stygiobacter sp.]|jgi:cell wall-associated NlpC family hydrolase|uniref:C40 family peptidase n=1 Tax=Stygiobacter electus TaxID=3032292 RepID=A0AAE3NYH1_9BACT|nr:C40 family peptidase [Stygiobacter electus]MDF1611037.1 C40 family peptidase [Stygiobacter electus]